MHSFVYLAQRRSQEFSREPNFGGGRALAPPLGCASASFAGYLMYFQSRTANCLCKRNWGLGLELVGLVGLVLKLGMGPG